MCYLRGVVSVLSKRSNQCDIYIYTGVCVWKGGGASKLAGYISEPTKITITAHSLFVFLKQRSQTPLVLTNDATPVALHLRFAAI